MHFSYLELTLLVLASFSFGGIVGYFILKKKISKLKDAVYSLDASLKGMWDTNEHWQKKLTALEKGNQPNKTTKTEKQIFAKHASDDSIELKERVS